MTAGPYCLVYIPSKRVLQGSPASHDKAGDVKVSLLMPACLACLMQSLNNAATVLSEKETFQVQLLQDCSKITSDKLSMPQPSTAGSQDP